MNNTKEFLEVVKEFTPIIIIVSVISTFLKGGKTLMEYIKAPLAALIFGLPAVCFVEWWNPDSTLLKYCIVIIVSSWSICIFNGTFKIFKKFEENPIECVNEIKELKDGGKRNPE